MPAQATSVNGSRRAASPRYVIEGGQRLRGAVSVSGAKNAVLPIIAATLLTTDDCVIDNVPRIADVETLSQLLKELGARVEWCGPNSLWVSARHLSNMAAPSDLVRRMRASFLVTGPLLARCGTAESPAPGGCALGTRPVSVDIKGFRAMGAEIEEQHGYYRAKATRLRGRHICLDYPSHTGTENLLTAACLADGTSLIENASVEPEVVDLAEFLISMGARIEGHGTGTIEVTGVERLHGTRHKVMADRLEAGTFMMAAAITGGDVLVQGANIRHLGALKTKMAEAGVSVERENGGVRVRAGRDLRAVDVQTHPYPGFPTDLQAPFAALMTRADGTSVVKETMYDDRLSYVAELREMGANILVEGNKLAIITGPCQLDGVPVRALDIRSGAAVVIAALAAEGETTINKVHYIERGYEHFDAKLRRLGAKMHRELA